MKVGDDYRLEHIKLMLKQKRTVYGSDRVYLDHLIDEYIEQIKTQKQLSKIRDDDSLEESPEIITSEEDIEDIEDIDDDGDDDGDDDELVELKYIYCWKCGKSIPVNSKFCLDCGSNIKNLEVKQKKSAQKIRKEIIEKEFNIKNEIKHDDKNSGKKRNWKKKIGIGFGVIIVLFFGLVILSSIASETTEIQLKNPELSPQEIQKQAIFGISFDQLMRDNGQYVDKILFLEGEVIQARNVSGDKYVLRISITRDNLGFSTIYYSDPVWVNYAGKRILEGDKVQFYGQVQGIKEYRAILGNSVEIPELNSLILEVGKIQIDELVKTSSSTSTSKCGAGTVFDDATNSCVLEGTQTTSKCGTGTVFDDATNSCVLEGT